MPAAVDWLSKSELPACNAARDLVPVGNGMSMPDLAEQDHYNIDNSLREMDCGHYSRGWHLNDGMP